MDKQTRTRTGQITRPVPYEQQTAVLLKFCSGNSSKFQFVYSPYESSGLRVQLLYHTGIPSTLFNY